MSTDTKATTSNNSRFLSNDFVFGEVMRTREICKSFLESLLNIQVETLQYPEKQKDLSEGADIHGVRLDIFVTDAEGSAYNIEMQNGPVVSLEKRARFYASAMDRYTLQKGEEYRDLRNSIVIFVCNYDTFGEGLAEYAVEKNLVGPGTDVRLPYNDGAQIYYLNAKYRTNNANAEITDFLDILRGENAATNFGKTVTDLIDEMMKNDATRRQIMTMDTRLNDEHYRGKLEGRQEGKNFSDAQTARKLLNLGWEKEKIAVFLEITPEQLAALLALPPET